MPEHEAFLYESFGTSGKSRYWGECACGFVGSMVTEPAESQGQVERHIQDATTGGADGS